MAPSAYVLTLDDSVPDPGKPFTGTVIFKGGQRFSQAYDACTDVIRQIIVRVLVDNKVLKPIQNSEEPIKQLAKFVTIQWSDSDRHLLVNMNIALD